MRDCVSWGSASAPAQLPSHTANGSTDSSSAGGLRGQMVEGGIGWIIPVGTPACKWWWSVVSASLVHTTSCCRRPRRKCWPKGISQSAIPPWFCNQLSISWRSGFRSWSIKGASSFCCWRCWRTLSWSPLRLPISSQRWRRSCKRSGWCATDQFPKLGKPPPSLTCRFCSVWPGCCKGWDQGVVEVPEEHLFVIIFARAKANHSGYSAVSELNQVFKSVFTPANDGCRGEHVHQEAKILMSGELEQKSHDLLSCISQWQAATLEQWAPQSFSISVFSGRRRVIADGGVSHPTNAPFVKAA